MKKSIFFLVGFFVLLFSPKLADAASLFVSPSSGSYGVGSSITVTVKVNTSDAANTAEANLTYSTDTLELTRVSQGATFYLPAPGSPAKSGATAYFGGGLPTPGYTGSNGILGTMTFRAKAEGPATISITSGKILLNDGLGTNALSSSSGARFTITPPAVGTPQVSSTTHPDQSKWYKGNRVDVSWTRPSGAYGFSFEFDQKEDTIPDNELDTTITTTKSYGDVKDGVWYFHLKARRESAGQGFGATNHFKVSIDTVAPSAFDLKLIGEESTNVISTPTIAFEAKDNLSGIDRYDIFIDSELYKSGVNSPFTFDALKSGEKNIKVTAFDKAGNQTNSELKIVVKGGPSLLSQLDRGISIPLYAFVLFNLLFLVLLMMVLWLFFKKGGTSGESPDIQRIQVEIDESLENLKQEISKKLLGLSAKSSEELFEKETVVAKQIRGGIAKTRKSIDSKIVKLKRNQQK